MRRSGSTGEQCVRIAWRWRSAKTHILQRENETACARRRRALVFQRRCRQRGVASRRCRCFAALPQRRAFATTQRICGITLQNVRVENAHALRARAFFL